MKTTAMRLSRLQLLPLSNPAVRLSDFIALTKPRVMSLAIFTALVGLLIAPGHPNPLLGSAAILAVAMGAGAAGALNMWYDADIDAVMTRTTMRPIPRGKVSRAEALTFGLVLAGCAIAMLAVAGNAAAVALLAFTIFFYVVVYTAWLKRYTRQNIVIGGAAGALPPVIGWAASTGQIGIEPLTLFLIIFFWTPPHFWALALNRSDEYARAGVPMLPVVAGRTATTSQILVYSLLLLPISELPWALGFASPIYALTAVASGAIFVWLALRLARSRNDDRKAAHHLFAFSIVYLFMLFTALLIGNAGNRGLAMLSRPSTTAGSTCSHTEYLFRTAQAKLGAVRVYLDEV